MAASTTPAHPAEMPASEDLLEVLFHVSMTGVILFRPEFAAGGTEIVDLVYVRLNAAAQQMLKLPEHPEQSFLTLYPTARPTGVFDFYCQAFQSATVKRHQFNYQHDGLDAYFYLAAQRSGPLLVVSFTDTNDQPRSAVEYALRQAQARERQAHAEAERERSLLQALLAQAPVAIALFQGPELRITTANVLMATMWGRTSGQVLGQPLLEALPELRGQGFDEQLRQVLTTQVPVAGTEAPARMLRNGQLQTTYYNFVYQPLYDAQGQLLGVVDVATEVTEQVLARRQIQQLNEELELRVTARSAETRAALFEAEQQREQLRQQQALLGAILSQVPAAVATLSGPQHRFTFFNEPYQALVLNRAGLGCPVAELLPEVEEQGFVALLDRVYTTGQPYVGTETPMLLHDPATGQLVQRYLDFVYQPLFDKQQQPQGILAFVVDVTERALSRKQADTLQAAMLAVAQRQAQERQDLYQVFEQAPVAIVLLRAPDHRIDYFNPAFDALFPRTKWSGTLPGHTLADVYPRFRQAGLIALLDEVCRTGESQDVVDMPLTAIQPDNPRYVTFSYQPYREQGRLVGVAAFVYDTTEQVLAREQVQHLNEELAATNAEVQAANQELATTNSRLLRTNTDLDTFVYTASHDLKSPITNIEGLLLALREQLPTVVQLDPLVTQLLDMMGGAVSRFQQTLTDLTDISRLQQAIEGQPIEEIDLAKLVEDVRLDILPEITAARAILTVALADCSTVHFSAKSLRSVVYNLLSNAIKYRHPARPPRVALHCQHTAGWVTLTVQDNGLGLSESQQGELFQMFRRLHTHTEGSGVGLYMVKKMIENVGGTITVQSALGEGSTFTVVLPVLAVT